MARLREKSALVTPTIERIWADALAAPQATKRCWLHGDLHAQNVLVDEHGVISAVIDWGDLTAGDVATAPAGIWALFEAPAARRAALGHYQPDQTLLTRAAGWALLFGVVLADSGLINSPRHAVAGQRILERLEADHPIEIA